MLRQSLSLKLTNWYMNLLVKSWTPSTSAHRNKMVCKSLVLIPFRFFKIFLHFLIFLYLEKLWFPCLLLPRYTWFFFLSSLFFVCILFSLLHSCSLCHCCFCKLPVSYLLVFSGFFVVPVLSSISIFSGFQSCQTALAFINPFLRAHFFPVYYTLRSMLCLLFLSLKNWHLY